MIKSQVMEKKNQYNTNSNQTIDASLFTFTNSNETQQKISNQQPQQNSNDVWGSVFSTPSTESTTVNTTKKISDFPDINFTNSSSTNSFIPEKKSGRNQ